WLLYKRLDRATFPLPVTLDASATHIAVSPEELTLMLRGLETGRARPISRLPGCTCRPAPRAGGGQGRRTGRLRVRRRRCRKFDAPPPAAAAVSSGSPRPRCAQESARHAQAASEGVAEERGRLRQR